MSTSHLLVFQITVGTEYNVKEKDLYESADQHSDATSDQSPVVCGFVTAVSIHTSHHKISDGRYDENDYSDDLKNVMYVSWKLEVGRIRFTCITI